MIKTFYFLRNMPVLVIMKKFLIPTSILSTTPVIVVAKESKSSEEKKEPCNMIKPSELPIYEKAAQACKPVEPEHERSDLEEAISVVRKELWVYVDELQHYKEKVVEYVETGKAHTEFIIDYLKEEDNYLPRAGAIGLGGLTGLVLGLRGGLIRRIFYGSAGAAAMASICYPREAAHYSKEAVVTAKKYAVIGYNFVYGVKPDGKADSSSHSEKKSVASTAQVQSQKLPSSMVNNSSTDSPIPLEKVEMSKEQMLESLPPIKLTGPLSSRVKASEPSSPTDPSNKAISTFSPAVTMPPTNLIYQPPPTGLNSVDCSSNSEESSHKRSEQPSR